MRYLNDVLLDGVASYTNQSSSAMDSSFIFSCSAQCVLSGTGSGTFKLQASNDKPAAANLATAAFTPTNWVDIPNATVTVTGAGAFLIPYTNVAYQFMRGVYTSTFLGVQTVTAVADVAGSLNSKYFLLNSANAGTGYYVWLNVNSAGVDPAVAGRTGVEVALATGATAPTVATAVAAAVDALANFVSSAVGAAITITNSATGPFTPASDGTAATAFTFAVAAPAGLVTVNLKSVGF